MSRFRSFAASAALGAAFAAVTFAVGSGTQLGRTSTVLVVIVLASGAVVAAGRAPPEARPALRRGRAAGLHGADVRHGAVARLVDRARRDARGHRPDVRLPGRVRGGRSSRPASRRRPPRSCSPGLLIATVTVAVWALLTRVFPGDLGGQVLAARLSEPFGYSNALGCMAAIGMPAALWLGTRRGAPVSSALGYPALGILLLTALLTQSRGALSAAAICLLIWLAVVPLRLRTIAQVSLHRPGGRPRGRLGAVQGRLHQAVPAGLRAGGGGRRLHAHAPGAGGRSRSRPGSRCTRRRRAGAPSLTMRRRAGFALAVLAGALVLGGVGSVAASDDGLGGTISDRVDEIRDEQVGPPKGAGRLGSVSSARGTYWRQAYRVFEERPSVGFGAGAFGLASLRHRRGPAGAEHAHGFIGPDGGGPRAGRARGRPRPARRLAGRRRPFHRAPAPSPARGVGRRARGRDRPGALPGRVRAALAGRLGLVHRGPRRRGHGGRRVRRRPGAAGAGRARGPAVPD